MAIPDPQMQAERTQRAIAALAAGEYKVTALEDGAWSVVNGDKTPYRVTHSTCECKDFENTSKLGLRCKHICAIYILFPQGAKQSMENTFSPITGWTRLYHPAGVQVTIPIPMDAPLSADAAQHTLTSVSNLLDAGWLTDAPGLEDGEQKQEVVSVSRRESKDGTPIVAFYLAHPKTVKKFLHQYLNKPEDIQAFEAATGLKLESIPLWMGERDIDRDHREAGKYIIPLSRPIHIIWETNPKWQAWSAEGGKATGAIEPHKRILVRYDGIAPAQAPTSKPVTSPLVRQYTDGTSVNGDANEQAAYDAFVKHGNGAKPASKESLKTWVAANRNLVAFKN
jgi:hypothetical protein